MRAAALMLMVLGAVVLTGCNGMVKSWEDRKNSYAQIFEYDMRQFADDWDLLWLAERPIRLTRWEMR